MTARRTPLRSLVRGMWRDGWIAAWLVVTSLNVVLSGFGLRWEWLAGAFFGASAGMVAGYLVTVQRNYRRTSREQLVRQLEDLKQLELRMIARGGNQLPLEHLRDGKRQIADAIEALS